jgi:hypothetical protein
VRFFVKIIPLYKEETKIEKSTETREKERERETGEKKRKREGEREKRETVLGQS